MGSGWVTTQHVLPPPEPEVISTVGSGWAGTGDSGRIASGIQDGGAIAEVAAKDSGSPVEGCSTSFSQSGNSSTSPANSIPACSGVGKEVSFNQSGKPSPSSGSAAGSPVSDGAEVSTNQSGSASIGSVGAGSTGAVSDITISCSQSGSASIGSVGAGSTGAVSTSVPSCSQSSTASLVGINFLVHFFLYGHDLIRLSRFGIHSDPIRHTVQTVLGFGDQFFFGCTLLRGQLLQPGQSRILVVPVDCRGGFFSRILLWVPLCQLEV